MHIGYFLFASVVTVADNTGLQKKFFSPALVLTRDVEAVIFQPLPLLLPYLSLLLPLPLTKNEKNDR